MKTESTLKIDAVRVLMDAIDTGIEFAFNGRAEKYLDRPKVWRGTHDDWFEQYNAILKERVENEIKNAICERLDPSDEDNSDVGTQILELRSTINWILAQMKIEKPERLVRFRDEVWADSGDDDWEHKE